MSSRPIIFRMAGQEVMLRPMDYEVASDEQGLTVIRMRLFGAHLVVVASPDQVIVSERPKEDREPVAAQKAAHD